MILEDKRLTACVSRWWAGRESLRDVEKARSQKKPVSRDESHQSAARFVGTLLNCKTHSPKKILPPN